MGENTEVNKNSKDDFIKKFSMMNGVDPQEVNSVVDCCMQIGWEFPLGALGDAIKHINPTEAMQIFKNEDLEKLRQRYETIYDYRYCNDPFYTLDELADQIMAFCDEYLEQNKDRLIETGYPERPFAQSLWLYHNLGKIYPVKLPVVYPGIAWIGLDDHITFDKWCEEKAELTAIDPSGSQTSKVGYRWEVGKALTNAVQPVTPCDYPKAAYLPGLNPEDARRLEGMRKILFGLRIRVLQNAIQAINNKNAESLLGNWFQDLSQSLNHDEINFLLRIDRFYENLNFDDTATHGFSIQAGIYRNPDLFKYVWLIQHFMEEITIGKFHKTRELLKALPPIGSYFESYGKPWKSKLDAALDKFSGLEVEEQEFLDAFDQKIRDTIWDKFYVTDPDTGEKYPLKFVNQFKERMRKHKATEALSLRLRGELVPYDFYNIREEAALIDAPRFLKIGDEWELYFEGKSSRIKDYSGMKYIACLLMEPGKEYRPEEMEGVLDAEYYEEDKSFPEEGEELTSRQRYKIYQKKDDGRRANDEARQKTIEEITRLKTKLHEQEALRKEGTGDPDYIGELKDELERATTSYNLIWTYNGRRKDEVESSEYQSAKKNLRRRVKQEIGRSIDHIRAEHKTLAGHLDKYINLTDLIYRPPFPIPWKTHR